MTVTIRLMSDWGLEPFYVDEGDGIYELTDRDVLQEEFNVPDHVIATLVAWDKIYQDIIDWSDPRGSDWASPHDEQRYIEQGRAAARLLRQHIPDDVKIRYLGRRHPSRVLLTANPQPLPIEPGPRSAMTGAEPR